MPGNEAPWCEDLTLEPTGGREDLKVTLRGRGGDNDGYIAWIKFIFGDGQEYVREENFGSHVDYSVDHTYTKAGTYTVRFHLRDEDGTERGGNDACEKTLTVTTTEEEIRIIEQPRTGGGVKGTILLAASGLFGLAIKRKQESE